MLTTRDIVRYMYERTLLKGHVSIRDVSKRFNITLSRATTAVKKCKQSGYIYCKGRQWYFTDKGINLIEEQAA